MELKRFTEKYKDSGYVSDLDCRIAYNKLSGLEDKIENGTLIEFPRVCTRKGLTYPYRVEFVDEYGDIDWEIFETKAEAEAKLKELSKE